MKVYFSILYFELFVNIFIFCFLKKRKKKERRIVITYEILANPVEFD
jgi:hypothetical protein